MRAWLGRCLFLSLGGLAAAACGAGDTVGDGVDEMSTVGTLAGAEAVARAQQWVDVKLQYCWAPNGGDNHAAGNYVCARTCRRRSHPEWDPYRSDCSGLVSWAWKLPPPGRVTWEFSPFRDEVTKTIDAIDLQPGDAVNNKNHIMLFKEWVKPGKQARFLEEPGCGGSMGYAREITSDVTVSGQTITPNGRGSFTAIRYLKIRPGASSTKSPDAGAADASTQTVEEVAEAIRGEVDKVSCESGIFGWAIGGPERALDVELSFFGARNARGASSSRTAANLRRPDLPAERAEYGFQFPIPLGARDGKPHPVFGYASDDKGNRKLLGGAPSTFTCAPPSFPLTKEVAVRRPLSDKVLAAWSRTKLDDVAKQEDEVVTTYDPGPDFPEKPLAVQADDGFDQIYVIDGELRRPIESSALQAWKLRPVQRPAADIAKLKDGPPWPMAPFFFQGTKAEIYALDAKLPEGAAGDSPSSMGPSNDDPSSDEDGVPASGAGAPAKRSPAATGNAGCGAHGGPDASGAGAFLFAIAAVAVARARRRRA